jgi:hypothetical protein
MTRNPYSPPEAKVSDLGQLPEGSSLPSERLYTADQIGLAAFLGTFFAASWFYGKNLAATGKPEKKSFALLVGFVATLAAAGIAYFLPDNIPGIVPSLLCYVAARSFAESKFRKIVAAHLAAGGRRGSWWTVVGMSLLFSLILVLVVLAAMLIFFRDSIF